MIIFDVQISINEKEELPHGTGEILQTFTMKSFF